jgi:hypothetical protein
VECFHEAPAERFVVLFWTEEARLVSSEDGEVTAGVLAVEPATLLVAPRGHRGESVSCPDASHTHAQRVARLAPLPAAAALGSDDVLRGRRRDRLAAADPRESGRAVGRQRERAEK